MFLRPEHRPEAENTAPRGSVATLALGSAYGYRGDCFGVRAVALSSSWRSATLTSVPDARPSQRDGTQPFCVGSSLIRSDSNQ